MNSSGDKAPKQAQTSAPDLRALAIRFQTILERERTHLAQELHDNLAQKLTIISLELALLQGNVLADYDQAPARLREKAKELSQLVNEMIQSLRKIKAQLRPKVLDEFGLLAALEWQSEEFSKRTGVQCRWKGPVEELELPTLLATELFRIFQEILANVAEHANACRVTIELKQTHGWLVIRVTDNGKGITRAQMDSPDSVGLLEIKERALLVGGQFEIEGTAGVGTTVSVKVPVPHRPTHAGNVPSQPEELP